jgi:hypothetical protein
MYGKTYLAEEAKSPVLHRKFYLHYKPFNTGIKSLRAKLPEEIFTGNFVS